MRSKNKSLFMQDNPGNSPTREQSHRFKVPWRKKLFYFAFKAMEVFLVILQIIQCLCEMLKK